MLKSAAAQAHARRQQSVHAVVVLLSHCILRRLYRHQPINLKGFTARMKYVSLITLRRMTALAAVLVLSMMLMPAGRAQGKQDFTLVNQTGVSINELYVSPHTTNEWEEDILGQDTLANGDSVDITF